MKLRKITAFILILAITVCFFGGCMKKSETKPAPIVVLGPMECENSTLISKLDNAEKITVGAYEFTEGEINGYPVVVVRCLIGMVNSATATTLAIEKYSPRCVIIQGTSGGHDPDLHKNDIVLGENLIETGNYQSAHRDEGEGVNVEDWVNLGEEILVDGEVVRVKTLHSDETLLSIAKSVEYPYGKVVSGTISSGDIWNREIDRIKWWHETCGSDCEEMEGFAVGQVCAQLGVPFLAIRILSNSELHPDEEFDESAGVTCQNYSYDVISAIIIQIG